MNFDKFDALNFDYWKAVKPTGIIGNNAVPGKELFKHLNKGDKVLDLGCGNGEIVNVLNEQGYDAYGVDINSKVIEALSKNSPEHFFTANVAEGTPFSENQFDAVVISFLLASFIDDEDINNLVTELKRILKPDGKLWLNDALVSPDYQMRYELSYPFIKKKNSFFVFKDKSLAAEINTPEDMTKIIDRKEFKRTSRHFTKEEIVSFFNQFKVLYEEDAVTKSPNTGMSINMTTIVFESL